MANQEIEAAATYHDITKHSYESVRRDAYALDWDNKPLPYKIYPEAASIGLPRDLSLSTVPALEVIAGGKRGAAAAAPDLGSLGRILFCAGGLTRSRDVGGEQYHFRAAASAGALYPIEIYIASGEVDGLAPGLYHFSPADLKLRGLRSGDWRSTIASACAKDDLVRESRVVLVLSAIFWRSAWKYRTRSYRYCFWDAGTILANLLAAVSAEGYQAEVLTAFADQPIERLLGIDGEREGVICAVAIGKSSAQAQAASEPAPLNLDIVPLSSKEVAYDELIRMHRASKLANTEEARRVASAVYELEAPAPAHKSFELEPIEPVNALGLGATILRRGSTRVFARESLDGKVVATIMDLSSGHPAADFPRLTDTYLIVNAVEGLEAGAYYYARERQSFDLLKAGDFRDRAGYLCLEQRLGADCSVLICYMANLQNVLQAFGNRGYRDAHLEAGYLGGCTYLAAYSLEHGASGLTFYDDDTTEFFSPHAAGKSPLLMVALGVPRTG
ncbi:MAG TPA: SagB/ThcOx family dehydrogenase [Candidatus Binataceae bacterium]|nr:SagB/ThcOx family dehydrogenase [Candidatus Binataceae bacterium]